METPHIRYAVEMLMRNGGVYTEQWKNILCMQRMNEVREMEINYNTLVLGSLANIIGKSMDFTGFLEEYASIMSLSHAKDRKKIMDDMEDLTNQIAGKKVKVRIL